MPKPLESQEAKAEVKACKIWLGEAEAEAKAGVGPMSDLNSSHQQNHGIQVFITKPLSSR